MLKSNFVYLLIFTCPIAIAINPVEKDGIKGNFDLGLNYTQNIEKTTQFNNVFLLTYKKGSSNITFGNNISFISKTGEDELLNKGAQDLKYSYKSKNLGCDLTLQHLYDISRSIKKRITIGFGFSYTFLQEDNKKLMIGMSALKEKETSAYGKIKIQNRISCNLDFSIKINKDIEFISVNNYQPNVQKFGDFRMKTLIAVRINLSPHFLLSINNTFNYDSYPELDIPENDYQLINSISYTF